MTTFIQGKLKKSFRQMIIDYYRISFCNLLRHEKAEKKNTRFGHTYVLDPKKRYFAYGI